MVTRQHHIGKSGDNHNHARTHSHLHSHPLPLRSDTSQSHKDHDTTQQSMDSSTGGIKAPVPCLPHLTYTSGPLPCKPISGQGVMVCPIQCPSTFDQLTFLPSQCDRPSLGNHWPIPTSNPHPQCYDSNSTYEHLTEQLYSSSVAVGTPQLDL